MSQKNTRIIGPHNGCLTGLLQGHDADEQRANQLEGGLVLCVFCGVYPEDVVNALATAGTDSNDSREIGAALRAGKIKFSMSQGSAIKDRESSEYAAACLSGHDPAQLDTVRMRFAFDNFQTASLTYGAGELLENKCDSDDSFGGSYEQGDFGNVPAAIDRAARELSKIGFRVTGPNFASSDGRDEWLSHSMRTIIMVRKPAGAQYSGGTKVELTYIV
jgi:hypothetical protein